MNWLVLPTNDEFSGWSPKAISQNLNSIVSVTLPRDEPSNALVGDSWSVVPINDGGPTMKQGEMVIGRSVVLNADGMAATAVYETAPMPLSELKKIKKSDINAKRDSLLVAGFAYDFGAPYGTKVMQTRDVDITNWLGVASAAQNAVIASVPDTAIPIRVEDNATIPLTAATVLPVLAALQAAQSAIHGTAWAKKDAVDAAADQAALDAVDVDVGWP